MIAVFHCNLIVNMHIVAYRW